MKTKNILFLAIALLAGTLLITPAFAQELDYHEQEYMPGIANTVKTSFQTTASKVKEQKQYLDIGYLTAYMTEDFGEISEEKRAELLQQATNSIQDNKVTDREQYDLISLAIETNHNDILEILLKAGFKDGSSVNPGLVPPLQNEYPSSSAEELPTRPTSYGGAHVSIPTVHGRIKVENEYGEQIGTIYSDKHANNVLVYDYSNNAIMLPSNGSSIMGNRKEIFKRLSEQDRADIQKNPSQLSNERREELYRIVDSINQQIIKERTTPNK